MRDQSLAALLVLLVSGHVLGASARADERPLVLVAALPAVPPSDGHAATVAGAILLALGSAALIGSAAMWGLGAARNPMGTAFAASLDVFGGALFVPGAVLLPVGMVKASRYRRRQRDHGAIMNWTPLATPTASGGMLGVLTQF